MKKLLPVLLIVLWNCSAKEAELKSVSPDGNIQIVIKGNKPSAVDPFQTEVSVLAEGFSKDPVMLEVFAAQLDSQTVNIQWTDNSHANIIFKQQDGTERKLVTGVEDNRLFLHE